MSIAVLGQVYDEVRRLSIAGSVVVPGDFRIKKLIPPLEQAATKSPVFGKVLEGVKKLSEANEKNASEALLELGTLVNAILYTQGETGAEGNLEPIVSKSFGVHKTQTSARALKPILESLTTTGSGRLEIIRDARDRKLFYDLRLIRPAIIALDDPYGEIADMIAEDVLPIYGNAIVPELQAQFSVKGHGGSARRLKLMHKLDPKTAREYVKKGLEEGSKDVRLAAIECLGTDEEDLSFLLDQVKAKAKEVRLACINGLGQMTHAHAAQAVCKAVDGPDLESACRIIAKCNHPTVIKHLVAATQAQLTLVLSGKTKDKKELGKAVERLNNLLNCLEGRGDSDTEKLILQLFADREKIAAVKAEPSGKDVIELLVNIMASSASPKVLQTLVDGHAELEEGSLDEAFRVACKTRKPAEVYKTFSPYLTAKVDEKKKAKDPAFAKREVIINAITSRSHYWYYRHDEDDRAIAKSLDPKWLDLAIALNHEEMIEATAIEGNKKSNEALSKLIKEKLPRVKDSYKAYELIAALARVKHPELLDVVIAAIEKEAKSTYAYSLYWVGRFIPDLPKEEALPRLEAILPKFSGRAQDQLVDYILDLKAK